MASEPEEASADEIASALAEPFEAREVKWKPAVVSGNRALALAYVDARVVQDRLDDVFGPAGWQDDYELLGDNSVVCRLRLRIGGEWVTKVDVGGPSEQPDGGDRMKAAFSDALKRAAVKFGVGRYLYRLPAQWLDYDPQRRQFTQAPALPQWALPTVPPTPGCIDSAEGRALASLLRKCKVPAAEFFKRFGITRLGELPEGKYRDAQLWISKEAAKRNEGKAS